MKFNTQQWTAPKKLTVFILICMITVLFFETLGLANKERNLEMRKSPIIEISVDKAQQTGEVMNYEFKSQKLNPESLQDIKNQVISQILIEGASQQISNEPSESFYDI